MIVSIFIIPLLLIIAISLAIIKKKDAYTSFVEGAKEGMKISIEIIPSILAMVSAVVILKASGIVTDFALVLAKYIDNGQFYANLAPMMFFRPISGSASLTILNDVCSIDADGLICRTASIIQGSTDTTFYVLALYFTSVNVKKWRHTLPAALFADFIGIAMAVIFGLLIFG